MPDRMRAEDMALLAAETPRAPRQVSVVMVLDPGPDGFDSERLQRLIDDRIALVPRYRQRVLPVLGGLAPPAWVDDEHFDLSYHVRRSALPRPGTMAQLRDLVARLVARPLDRERPLWEIYLIEGLERGHVAVVLKSHEALVDGTETVALGQIILDETPEPPTLPADHWAPVVAPSQISLAAESVLHLGAQPAAAAAAGPHHGADHGRHRRAARGRGGAADSRAGAHSPLSRQLSRQRRFVTVASGLDDHRAVREAHGGTVNDVVLSAVTGALRAWLLTRGEQLTRRSRPSGRWSR
jgi:diacylglycerol O-acyltransferase